MEIDYEYHDRDLSWLSFNYRILQEAADPNLPVYDRLKFIAIYSSNLDEFFRVRVASIRSLGEIGKKKLNQKLNLKPRKLHKTILKEVNRQLGEYGKVLRGQILPELNSSGVHLYFGDSLLPIHKDAVNYLFRTKVLAFLKPVFMKEGNEERFFLDNCAIYLALRLKSKQDPERLEYAYINIPSDDLPRFHELPETDRQFHYITLDDIIREHLNFVFPDHEVLNCCSIKLNKDADLHIDDEYDGNLIEKINKQIDKRNIGTPSRFLYDATMPDDLKEACSIAFGLSDQDMVAGGRYHNLNDLMKLPNPLGKTLESPKRKPLFYPPLDLAKSLFEEIRDRDHMLHFPYFSYDYVLRFFNEAAIDPKVRSLKITLYRMASQSLIGQALISAAKNGKEVTVFVEVKARFDEENNLRWAKRMEEAGIKIIYSIPGLKVHAKVALVQREEADGSLRGFAFLGTGNFNEVTAGVYSDSGLLTGKQSITAELDRVFHYLLDRTEPAPFEHILVSQFNLKERFIEAIDREIAWAKQGKEAHMIVKVNNLESQEMIDKLYEASQAGVKIDMLVRTICCLKPEVEGYSENIRITRIVDTFLEHARVWIFNNGGDPDVYLGSSDWMNRNLLRRIEVVYPVLDESIKAEVRSLIDLQFADNTKAAWLNTDLENIRKTPEKGALKISAQQAIHDFLTQKVRAMEARV